MSSVDKRVVEMQFDNKEFQKNIATTIEALKQLDNSLILKNGAKGFEAAQRAINNFSTASAVQQVDTIASHFSSIAEKAQSAFSTVIGAVGKFGAVAGGVITTVATGIGGLAAHGGFARAMNIRQAKFQLEGLGVSWKKIEDDLSYAVTDTAFGLDSAAKAAAQLVASNVEVGSSMKTALRGISGVAAQTSSSYDDIAQVFTRVAGNGRLMAQDLMSLSGRGLNAAATLAKAMNKTEKEVREMVSKGEIDFATFAKAMDDAFGTHAKEANSTITGVIDNLKATLSRIGEPIAEAGIANAYEILNWILPKLKKFKDLLEPVIKQISNALVTIRKAIMSVLKVFATNKNMKDFVTLLHLSMSALKLFGKIVKQVFKPLKKIIKDFFETLKIQSFVAVMSSIKQTMADLAKSMQKPSEIIKRVWYTIRQILGNLFGDLAHLILGLAVDFSIVIRTISDNLELIESVIFPPIRFILYQLRKWYLVFRNIFVGIINTVKMVVQIVQTDFAQGFLKGFVKAGKAIDLAKTWTKFFYHFPLIAALRDILKKVLNWSNKFATSFKNNPVVNAVQNFFDSLGGKKKGKKAAKDLNNTLKDITKAFKKFNKEVSSRMDEVGKFFDGLGKIVSEELNPAFEELRTAFESFDWTFGLKNKNAPGNMILEIVDALAEFAKPILTKAVKLAAKAVAAAIKGIASIVNWINKKKIGKVIRKVIKDITTGFKDFSKGMSERIDKVSEFFTGLSDTITSTVTPAFEGLKGTFESIDWSFGVEDSSIGDTLLSIVDSLAAFASPVITAAVTAASNAIALAMEGIKTAVEWLKANFGGILDTVSSVAGQALGFLSEKFSELGEWLMSLDWEGFFKTFEPVITAIADFVQNLIENGPKLEDVSKVFEGIMDTVSGVIAFFTGSSGSVDVNELVGGDANEVQNDLDGVTDSVDEVNGAIGDFNSQAETATNTMNGVNNAIGDFSDKADRAKTTVGNFMKPFGGAVDMFDDIHEASGLMSGSLIGGLQKATEVGEAWGDETQNNVNVIEDLTSTGLPDWATVAGSALGILGGIVGIKLGLSLINAIKAFKGMVESIQSIGDLLGSISDSFGALKESLEANRILKFAASLLILAVALKVMSTIEIPNLIVSALILLVFAKLMKKMMEEFSDIKKFNPVRVKEMAMSMLMIGGSMALLAVAMRLIGSMDPISLTQSIMVLSGFMIVLNKLFKNSKGAKGARTTAQQMLDLGKGLILLAAAIAIFGVMPMDMVVQGIGTVIIILGVITLMLKFLGKSKIGSIESTVSGIALLMLSIAASMLILSNIPTNQLEPAIKAMAAAVVAMLVLFAGIAAVEKFIGPLTIGPTIAAMLSMAGALLIISAALLVLAQVPAERVDQVIQMLGAIALGMAVVTAAMGLFGKGVLLFGAGIALLGAGLLLGAFAALVFVAAAGSLIGIINMLIPAIQQISANLAEFAKAGLAMLALGIGFAVLGVGLAVIAVVVLVAAVALVIGAAGLLIFAEAMKAVSGNTEAIIDFFKQIGASLGDIALASVGFILLGIACVVLGAGLVVLGAGLLICAAAFWVFAQGVATILNINWDSLAADAGDGAGKIPDEVIENIRSKVTNIVEAMLAIATAIMHGLADGIRNNKDALFDAMGDLASAILEFIADLGWRILQGIGGFFGDLGNGFMDFMWKFSNGDFGGAFEVIASNFSSGTEEAGEALNDGMEQATDQANDTTKDGFEAMAETAKSGIEDIKEQVSGGDVVGSFTDQFTNGEGEASVEDFTKSMGIKMDAGTDDWSKIMEKGGGKVDKSLVKSLTNASKNSGKASKKGMTKSGIEAAKAYGTALTKRGKKAASDAGKAVATAGYKGADSNKGKYQTVGYNAATGYGNGIKSGTTYVTSAVKHLINLAILEANRTQKSKSPSRVTMQIGKYFSQGYANGITKYSNEVTRAARDVVRSGTNALRSSYLFDDMTLNPTIRPVVDLTDVNRKSAMMNRMLSDAPRLRMQGMADVYSNSQNPSQTYNQIRIQLNYGADTDANRIVNDIANGLASKLAMEG